MPMWIDYPQITIIGYGAAANRPATAEAPYHGWWSWDTHEFWISDIFLVWWLVGADNYTVRVSSDDTTPGLLDTKLVGSTYIQLVIVNDGGDEEVRFDLADLPASKITSGVFDVARIPNLDASKITTGVFDPARIPDMGSDVEIKEAEIDLGDLAVRAAVVTVTDVDVSPTSKLLVTHSGKAATGRDEDENEADSLICKPVAGTGEFTLYVSGHPGVVKGKYVISYLIGS